MKKSIFSMIAVVAMAVCTMSSSHAQGNSNDKSILVTTKNGGIVTIQFGGVVTSMRRLTDPPGGMGGDGNCPSLCTCSKGACYWRIDVIVGTGTVKESLVLPSEASWRTDINGAYLNEFGLLQLDNFIW